MTLAEIGLALDEPGQRPHGGRGQPQSDQEMLEELTRWRGLTPKERLKSRKEAI